jgi:hypothetical protein
VNDRKRLARLPKKEIKKLAILGGADEQETEEDTMTKEEMMAYAKKDLAKSLALYGLAVGGTIGGMYLLERKVKQFRQGKS